MFAGVLQGHYQSRAEPQQNWGWPGAGCWHLGVCLAGLSLAHDHVRQLHRQQRHKPGSCDIQRQQDPADDNGQRLLIHGYVMEQGRHGKGPVR